MTSAQPWFRSSWQDVRAAANGSVYSTPRCRLARTSFSNAIPRPKIPTLTPPNSRTVQGCTRSASAEPLTS